MPLQHPSAIPSPFDIIERVAVKRRTVDVEFYDPEQDTVAVPYDPDTGEGGERVHVVLWATKARLVPLGTGQANSHIQFGTRTGFLADIALDPALPLFRPGVCMRAVTGPLAGIGISTGTVFEVMEAVDSSNTPMRRITLAADLARNSG